MDGLGPQLNPPPRPCKINANTQTGIRSSQGLRDQRLQPYGGSRRIRNVRGKVQTRREDPRQGSLRQTPGKAREADDHRALAVHTPRGDFRSPERAEPGASARYPCGGGSSDGASERPSASGHSTRHPGPGHPPYGCLAGSRVSAGVPDEGGTLCEGGRIYSRG